MTTTPKRIQRKRTKGWRMPEGAVYVGRPSKWGNPYKIGESDPMSLGGILDATTAVRMFEWYAWLLWADEGIPELRGKDLACFCPLDQPCHADVLLELANREATPDGP